MTGDEIVRLAKQHTIFEWAVQGTADPVPVAHAKGVHFWTPEGKRITEQIQKVTYVTPSMVIEARARLGAKLAEIAPGDIDVFFFTNPPLCITEAELREGFGIIDASLVAAGL